ncbi:MAG TPA: TolC family protein [Gemmatimonadaceae bacterium]|nr:TolC family protein [Gemmatimonadaceae bacterium]
MTIVHHRISRRLGAVLAFLTLAAAPAAARAQDTTLAHPLSLGDAARLAARQSASAQAARFRSEQAAARISQSRAALLPNFSVDAIESGHTINTATFGLELPGMNPDGEIIGPVKTLDTRGRLSLSLLDLGALGRVKSARSAADASEADAVNVAEQSAALAAAAYLRTQRADAQLLARLADSVLADSLLGIARDQFRAGVGVALDVTRAEAQVASVRAQLIVARNERDRASLELQRALGLSLGTTVRLADSLSTLPISDTLPDEQAAIERAMRQRPDLRAADAQLQAAEQQASAIKAERLPSVGVFGDEGWLGTNSGNMLNTYTWGVQVSLPIFDGFRREGRIQEQEAVAREVDVRRRDLRQQAAIEVRGALLDLRSAREQVDAARERLRLAEQELKQAQDRFTAGVAGNADVITASLSLNASRNLVIDALTSYQSARVSLARAEGSVTTLP